jgi:Reverse transcriptase (RNA-dependent DNA polymerase)
VADCKGGRLQRSQIKKVADCKGGRSHSWQIAKVGGTFVVYLGYICGTFVVHLLFKTVLRRRDRIIKAVKARYQRCEQKFGLELPKTVKRALEIDEETGTTYWRDAIHKEMKTVFPAFEFLDEGAGKPICYQQITCHLVFDIKMDFTCKARFVAGGHMTDAPSSIPYASVVSHESVCIALLIAALNDLEVAGGDVQGAYLNAPCGEKVYIICGPEFGEFAGCIAVIIKALYGLKSSCFAWHSHLAETFSSLGFTMCVADNNVWMRATTRKDGTEYYEYVLVFTVDLLCISTNPMQIFTCIDQHYILKPGSIGKPSQYLGAQVSEYCLPGEPEKVRWSLSSEKYVKEAIRNVQNWLTDHNMKSLKTRAPSVLPSGYQPELDATEYCDDELANYYQQQIGVL